MGRIPDTTSDLMPLRVRDSLEAILEYLWHDEERHYAISDDPNASHIFEHLRVIREWLEPMNFQPKK